MRFILNGVEVVPKQPTLTRKDWIASLKPGRQMVCTYRWYWKEGSEREQQQAPADGRQLCTIANVRATQMNYTVPDKDKLQWMDFPRASELKATVNGFELYFPDEPGLRDPTNGPVRAGKLMSRYEWVA
jgi:hypothetical protein